VRDGTGNVLRTASEEPDSLRAYECAADGVVVARDGTEEEGGEDGDDAEEDEDEDEEDVEV